MAIEPPCDPSRLAKAAKILAVIQDTMDLKLSDALCLDVGCAHGAITQFLAQRIGFMVGTDIDRDAISQAYTQKTGENLAYAITDGSMLALPTERFDLVICAQVYEHTQNQPALVEEIWRVLKPGGLCFFSGPNRLAIIEEHYWLPFLSWLPQPLADFYMRVCRKGKAYDVHPMTYWQLRRLWGRFKCRDYTTALIKNPDRYAFRQGLGKMGWVSRVPKFVLDAFVFWLPNYNWVLRKMV